MAPEPVDTSPPTPESKMNWELVIDKFVDFILIFVGLYAAGAVQRYQDDAKEKHEYGALLADFERELLANQAQHVNIEHDLGPVAETRAGAVLGPMQKTFAKFDEEMNSDEELVQCLHHEFASSRVAPAGKGAPKTKADPHCHALYAAFEKANQERTAQHKSAATPFEPAVLSPFYRYEVWELYVATGARLFKNKDLAVKIGEIYNNAHLIEKQVAEIESTYNDTFMTQVGRMSASDAELAEVIHDEETEHGLSLQDLEELKDIGESMKEERFAVLEAKSVLEMRVRRMKSTVAKTNGEIESVVKLVREERQRLGM